MSQPYHERLIDELISAVRVVEKQNQFGIATRADWERMRDAEIALRVALGASTDNLMSDQVWGR